MMSGGDSAVAQGKPPRALPVSARDLAAGVMTSIVMIAATLSYAALIYHGPLAVEMPQGIGSGLLTAGIAALVFACLSRLPFAIAGPDSKSTAVLATMTVGLGKVLADHQVPDAGFVTLVAVAVGTLITGVVLYVCGLLRLGRYIRFSPYPVIGGFLAASGWQLAVGSLRVLVADPLTLSSLGVLLHPATASLIGTGALMVLLQGLANRTGYSLAGPGSLVLGAVAIHLALWAAGYGLDDARADGWLLNMQSAAASPVPWFLPQMHGFPWPMLGWAAGAYSALAIVTTVTLLLGTVSVEVRARMDVDLDHELRINGLANILSGAGGGMVGTLSVNRTMFNFEMGARDRVAGIVVGAICLTLLAAGSQVLTYVPVPILAAMLLRLGWSMLDEWLIKGWQRMQRVDYVQVLIIMLVIVCWDFVAGIAVGVLAACVSFAVNFSRIPLVKRRLSRSEYASRVDRPRTHLEQLARHGNAIQILWPHGFIFFGSADRLLRHVQDLLAKSGRGVCRMLVLDFREVLGIDSSAVLSLIKLRHLAEREDFMIVLSGLSRGVARSLQLGGFLAANPVTDSRCQVFPDVDSALEWCEDQLLSELMTRDEARRSADEWLAAEIGSDELFKRLVSYLETVEHGPGEYLFRQGDAADSLSLLVSGRVTIVFRTQEGAEVRLRSIVRHTIVGEMGLYRASLRGASVIVDQPAIVYRLSAEALAQMEEDEPRLAYAFHKFVIRILAARLDFANREVASLQR